MAVMYVLPKQCFHILFKTQLIEMDKTGKQHLFNLSQNSRKWLQNSEKDPANLYIQNTGGTSFYVDVSIINLTKIFKNNIKITSAKFQISHEVKFKLFSVTKITSLQYHFVRML